MIHTSFKSYSDPLPSMVDMSFECHPQVADALQDPPGSADGAAYRGLF
jgi:hypothetical protein